MRTICLKQVGNHLLLVMQVMKVFTTYFVERRWDLKMLLGSGGMPSSHSALCVGLTTSVALCHGVSDCLFPVCLGFTLIVMYDAAGVRRHAGRQAEVCLPLSVRLPVMNSTIWPGTWISLMWLSYCNGSYLCCQRPEIGKCPGTM
jgi:acid phosphatase family membrane protein YuiD